MQIYMPFLTQRYMRKQAKNSLFFLLSDHNTVLSRGLTHRIFECRVKSVLRCEPCIDTDCSYEGISSVCLRAVS